MPGQDPQRDGDEAVGIGIEDPEGCLRFIGRVFRDVSSRRVAAVAEGAPAALRRPRDLERRRRHELRHARARQPAPRLRPRPAPRRARRAARAQGREGADARRRRAHAEPPRISSSPTASAPSGSPGSWAARRPRSPSSTTNVLLEAANFEPVGILRSSERHSLRTEGSNRWEKGVDPYVAGQAATYATQLIVELSGARWTGAEDVQGDLPKPAMIRLRPERASALIGLEVPEDEQAEILGRLGFEPAEERLSRADVARARRDARGRPDRGGRALQAPRDPVHAAAAARRCSGG